MESSGIQRIFFVLWTMIKLNLYFILFTLLGGVVLGIGPAFQTANDLLMEYGINYEEITFRRFGQQWQANFQWSNRHFWLWSILLILFGYNLYLATQLKGWLWLIVSFCLIFMCVTMVVFFLYTTLYRSLYDSPILTIWKLAFISIFLNFTALLKLLFGLVSILFLTWYFKGLLLFATFAMILIWSGYATKDNRTLIDRKIWGNE